MRHAASGSRSWLPCALLTAALLWSTPARADSCSCPVVQCPNGTVPACTIECPNSDPVCVCAGFCNAAGDPEGVNRCRCQPVPPAVEN